MAPSSCIEFSAAEQARLLGIARAAIAAGLATRRPPDTTAGRHADAQGGRRGNFVTLTQSGELRGCMGNLTGSAPLARDIAHTAFNAAFRDPRFAPLRTAEFDDTRIAISVLSAPEPVEVDDYDDLLGRLRPHVHGLLVTDRGRRGTLLPQVWEQLPEPREFVAHVMLKAGLRPGHWSDSLRFFTYESVSFAEPAAATA